MVQTILSAIAVFISTSIDYVFLLLIIFSQAHSKSQVRQVFAGQYLGTALLVIVSLIAAFALNLIPQDWIVGFLGLIPIALGIHFALSGEEEAEADEVIEKLSSKDSKYLFWTVALLTLASGGDNLGIYIPYFTTLSVQEIILVVLLFALFIFVLCVVSYRLARISFVSETLEKYERIIVPLVFVGLGIYILIENHTIQTLIAFIS
ncbi:MAG: CadD family cadmium resistance transporter [Coriobacteriia bacterium]|nr:CadD family cadmium resistance transporter [Coriobacteriia bacterium]